jgi:ribosomal protein S3
VKVWIFKGEIMDTHEHNKAQSGDAEKPAANQG